MRKQMLGTAAGSYFANSVTATKYIQNYGIAGVAKQTPGGRWYVEVAEGSITPEQESRIVGYQAKEPSQNKSWMDDDDPDEVARHEARVSKQESSDVSITPPSSYAPPPDTDEDVEEEGKGFRKLTPEQKVQYAAAKENQAYNKRQGSQMHKIITSQRSQEESQLSGMARLRKSLMSVGQSNPVEVLADKLRGKSIMDSLNEQEDDKQAFSNLWDSAKKEDKSFDKGRDKEFSKAWYAANRQNDKLDEKSYQDDWAEAIRENTKMLKLENEDKKKADKGRSGGSGSSGGSSNPIEMLGTALGAAFKLATAGAGAAITLGSAIANSAEREQIGGANTGYTRSSYAGLLKQMGLGNQIGGQVLNNAANTTASVQQDPSSLGSILSRMATANALSGGSELDLQGVAQNLLKGDTDGYMNIMQTWASKNDPRAANSVLSVGGLSQLKRSKGSLDSKDVLQREDYTNDILSERIKLESALADALGGNLQPAVEGSTEALKGFIEAATEAVEDLRGEVVGVHNAVSSGVNDFVGKEVVLSNEQVRAKFDRTPEQIESSMNPTGSRTITGTIANVIKPILAKKKELEEHKPIFVGRAGFNPSMFEDEVLTETRKTPKLNVERPKPNVPIDDLVMKDGMGADAYIKRMLENRVKRGESVNGGMADNREITVHVTGEVKAPDGAVARIQGTKTGVRVTSRS